MRLAPSRTRILAGIVLLCVTLTPFAAGSVIPGDRMDFPVKPFGASSIGTMTQTAAGKFNGDTQIDAAVLVGGVPRICVNPVVFDAQVELPTSSASLIASLRGTAAGGYDELLVVDGVEMRAWTRDSDLETFTSRRVGRDVVWRNALVLGTADLDGANGIDIFGATANGAYVIVLLSTGGSSFGTEILIPTSQTPLDIEAIDWDGDGIRELAVVGSAGLEVFEATGGAAIASETSLAGGFLTTIIDSPPSVDECLAWVIPGSGGGADYLYRIRQTGFVGSPLDLNGFEPIDVVSADFDLDGADDLLLTGTASYNHLLLENVNDSFSLTANEYQEIPFGPQAGSAADNAGTLLVVDFDEDGDFDVLSPAQAFETIFEYRNFSVDEALQKPSIDGGSIDYIAGSGGNPDALFELLVAEPVVLDVNATHLELVGYEATFDNGMTTSSAPAAGFVHVLPLQATFPDPYVHTIGPITLTDPDSKAYLFFVRAVEMNQGVVEHAYPALTLAYTTDTAGGTIHGALVDLGAEDLLSVPVVPNTPPPPGVDPTKTITTLLELIPLEGFDDGEEPDTDP